MFAVNSSFPHDCDEQQVNAKKCRGIYQYVREISQRTFLIRGKNFAYFVDYIIIGLFHEDG
jgi:hypothetical protein